MNKFIVGDRVVLTASNHLLVPGSTGVVESVYDTHVLVRWDNGNFVAIEYPDHIRLDLGPEQGVL